MIVMFGVMTVGDCHMTLNTIPLCVAKGTSFSEEDNMDIQIYNLNNYYLIQPLPVGHLLPGEFMNILCGTLNRADTN